MADVINYRITNMRAVFPEGKVAEKNPDRFVTVYGEFHPVGANGKPGDALSITSKAIDVETASNPLFAIDVDAGTLTLPEGRRGRTASESVSQDTLAERLAALRKG